MFAGTTEYEDKEKCFTEKKGESNNDDFYDQDKKKEEDDEDDLDDSLLDTNKI